MRAPPAGLESERPGMHPEHSTLHPHSQDRLEEPGRESATGKLTQKHVQPQQSCGLLQPGAGGSGHYPESGERPGLFTEPTNRPDQKRRRPGTRCQPRKLAGREALTASPAPALTQKIDQRITLWPAFWQPT